MPTIVFGTLYEDNVGQRIRYVTPGFDVYNFYNEGRGYVVSTETSKCRSYPLQGEAYDFFGPLRNEATSLNAACQHNDLEGGGGDSGLLWGIQLSHKRAVTWCVEDYQVSNPLPYYIVWQSPGMPSWLTFHSYIPGRPSNSIYDLPESCTQ
jgi:hypothetical protein